MQTQSKLQKLVTESEKDDFDPTDSAYKDLFQKIETDFLEKREKYKDDIEKLDAEIKVLQAKVKQNEATIMKMEAEITELSTGSIEEKLYERINNPGQEFSCSGIYKSSVNIEAKHRRWLDRGGVGDISEHEGELEKNPHINIVGRNTWRWVRNITLHKNYEIVPHYLSEAEKQKKLDELAGGVGYRKVFLDDGVGWRIDIDSAGDIKFVGIRSHDSGKKFMYSYRESFTKNPPYPKLIINAVLPKSVFHAKLIEEKKIKIDKLKNENTAAKQQLAIKEGSKKGYEGELKRIEDTINSSIKNSLEQAILNMKTQLENYENEIAIRQKELEAKEEEQKVAQYDHKRCTVSINYNLDMMNATYACSKVFKPADRNKVGDTFQQKSLEVLKRCQSFVRLYEARIEEIKADIAEMLKV